jgi:hypothetical protein
MRRARTLNCYLAILAVMSVAVAAQQPAYESKPVTLTATIDAIDKANRVVTLKGREGNTFDVKAPDAMEGFNNLKVGDQVSATYFEAVAIHVRRPGEPAPSGDPTTIVERKDRTPGSLTRKQQTFSGTIEALDKTAQSIRVRDARGRVLALAVREPKQWQTLKTGDTVDLTYYESLLVKVERVPAKK